MAKKEEPVIEKVYTIPLRKKWLKAPRYKRAKKAIKAIREFIARHMKVYDSNIQIKISDWVNKAIWCRGIKNVPHQITVKVTKKSDEILVEFLGLPKKFKQEESRLKKKKEKSLRKTAERERKTKEKEEERKKQEKEKKVEEKEKTEEEKIEEEKKKEEEKELHKLTKEQEKQLLKLSKKKEQIIHRKALEK